MQVENETLSQIIAKAHEYIGANNTVEVVKLLESSSSLRQNIELRDYILALTALRIENFTEALDIVKRLSDEEPDNQVYCELAAIASAKLGKLSDALFYLKMSTTCTISDGDLIYVPQWIGSAETAIANIEEKPFYSKAQRAFAQGDTSTAISSLQQSLMADPYFVDSWTLLAEVLETQYRFGDALQAYKAAKDAGDLAEKFMVRGLVLSSMLADESIEDFEADILKTISDEIPAPNTKDFYKEANLHKSLVSARTYQANSRSSEQYSNLKKAWRETFIAEVERKKVVPISGRQVNVGLYSSKLGAYRGLDPIAEFFLHLLVSGSVPWMGLKIYSNSLDEDSQVRRLAARSNDYRNVSGIDPATLIRIMENDEIHILLNLDGFSVSGLPMLENGCFGVYVDFSDREISKVSNGLASCVRRPTELLSATSSLENAVVPMAVRLNESKKLIKSNDVDSCKKLLISSSIVDLTDDFMRMLQALAERNKAIVFVIDTMRVGGISSCDKYSQYFEQYELSHHLEFAEPDIDRFSYFDKLLTDVSIAICFGDNNALQNCYNAMTKNVLCYLYLPGALDYSRASDLLEKIGLRNQIFQSLDQMFEALNKNFDSVENMTSAQETQNKAVSDFASSSALQNRIDEFADFILSLAKSCFGEECLEQLPIVEKDDA